MRPGTTRSPKQHVRRLANTVVWFTVAIAIVATASGLVASVFAVSRMLAMLTDMNIIPHKHFGMPGTIQVHTLVYTVVIAALLAAFFELSRIASLGVIFYLVMDIEIHVGVLRYLRHEVGAKAWILSCAIAIDSVVLVAFLIIKGRVDPAIIVISIVMIAAIVGFERFFLAKHRVTDPAHNNAAHGH